MVETAAGGAQALRLAGQGPQGDVLVIFGITGDLGKVMTFRSLYGLEQRGLLDCAIVGVAVDDWSMDQLVERARTSIEGTGETIDQAVFDRLTGRPARDRSDRLVPYALFTDPQLAGVGMNELEARRAGRTYEVASMPFASVARAAELGQETGILKLLYDPAADRWTVRASVPTPRDHLAVAALDGKLYAVGGRRNGNYGQNLGVNEAYDPATDRWQARAEMPTARSGIAAAVLDGRMFVFGGEAPSGTFGEVEAYAQASYAHRNEVGYENFRFPDRVVASPTLGVAGTYGQPGAIVFAGVPMSPVSLVVPGFLLKSPISLFNRNPAPLTTTCEP